MIDTLNARRAALVETMAEAAYESTRLPGSSRPAWAGCTEGWRDMGRQEIQAALTAASRAGWTMVQRG